jgi:IrrE N-terminal-like domain
MIGPWGRAFGYRVATKTLAQIRAAANAARFALKIDQPNIDMVDLLENQLRRNGIHFHIVDPAAIPGEAARAIPDEGMILIAADVYDAIHSEDPSHQLLVPHEIAHIALRHAATFARTTSIKLHTSLEDSEVQADRFSHEFVMPIDLVQKHCKSMADIVRIFNVPQEEAEIRIDQLRRERLIPW